MKKLVFSLLLCLSVLFTYAQTAKNVKYVFKEANDLTMIGRLFNDNPNPYHRVDTIRFKGFTTGENLQVRESSGMACLFKTNSTTVSVKTIYGTTQFPTNTNGQAARGYDLYIKKDGKWLLAASGVNSDKNLAKNLVLIKDMDNSEKECMLYLPLFSEVRSVQIGIEEGASIKALPTPFRHRVAIFGSSYTHGSSTSRCGMTYPAQFTRNTGIQLLSLGCSGNCKLQTYFCDVLCAVEADAFIFDSFSNPDAAMIKERLFPFIEKFQKAHPGKPLIFQQTIRRESRNFSLSKDKHEQDKIDMAEKMMKEAVKKYKDVYFIHPNATSATHDASVDGVHPDNYGYTLWEQSIEKDVLNILKKYGIK